MQCCRDCRYSHLAGLVIKTLVCRRYPPAARAQMWAGSGASVYPPVSGDGWCGEYKDDMARK